MRVGVRAPARSSGGGKAFYERLTPALVASDQCERVTIFELGPEPGGSSLEAGGLDLVHVPTGASPVQRRLHGSRALRRHFAEHPIDVLLSPGTETARLPDIPVIMWPLTVAPFESSSESPLGSTLSQRAHWSALRLSIKSAARHADAFVFSSHYARALHEAHIPLIRERPSCVILPTGSIGLDDRSEPPSLASPFILFVSHLYPYKMVLELIAGFEAACRKGVRHDLVIAGGHVDVRYSQEIRALTESLGVTQRVHLLGDTSKEKLAGLYRAADLFVFPSSSENAGSFALLDAFAFGLPVLTSGMSSMPEVAQNGARYFDPRSPEHLAAEIVNALKDGTSTRNLARLSRERADDLPTWDDIAKQLLAFLAAVKREYI